MREREREREMETLLLVKYAHDETTSGGSASIDEIKEGSEHETSEDDG